MLGEITRGLDRITLSLYKVARARTRLEISSGYLGKTGFVIWVGIYTRWLGAH